MKWKFIALSGLCDITLSNWHTRKTSRSLTAGELKQRKMLNRHKNGGRGQKLETVPYEEFHL